MARKRSRNQGKQPPGNNHDSAVPGSTNQKQ